MAHSKQPSYPSKKSLSNVYGFGWIIQFLCTFFESPFSANSNQPIKKRSGGEEEGGGKPMADATPNDVLAMSVLYIFYYSGEIILVAFQTVIIMYLRRSRIVLGTVVFSSFFR